MKRTKEKQFKKSNKQHALEIEEKLVRVSVDKRRRRVHNVAGKVLDAKVNFAAATLCWLFNSRMACQDMGFLLVKDIEKIHIANLVCGVLLQA